MDISAIITLGATAVMTLIAFLGKRTIDSNDRANDKSREETNRRFDLIQLDLKTLLSSHGVQSGDIRVVQEQIRTLQLEMKSIDERARTNHEEVLLGRTRYHELAGKVQAALTRLELLRAAIPDVEDNGAIG